MRIEDAQVTLAATHVATRSQVSELSTECGFRQVYQAQSQEAPGTAERARVVKLLQALVSAIMAAIEGQPARENFAAEDCLPAPAPADQPVTRQFEWHCRATETFCEAEKTSVSGHGSVSTQDGRTFNFNVAVDLARSYKSERVSEQMESIVLRDPLVINFDGKSSELSATKMAFDLDADGQLESIPELAASSGYLVFDRNGNGQIDDGREMLGALSGNGFTDLAQFDQDRNGWIDEADAAFSQLAVWSAGSLSTLAERAVGALYTAAVDAPFSLKTADNQLLGQIKAAGIYLAENGVVGNLQQLDLAVSAVSPGQEQPG